MVLDGYDVLQNDSVMRSTKNQFEEEALVCIHAIQMYVIIQNI